MNILCWSHIDVYVHMSYENKLSKELLENEHASRPSLPPVGHFEFGIDQQTLPRVIFM